MALVGKACRGSRLGTLRSLFDQIAGEAKPPVADSCARGQAGHHFDVADELETGNASRCCEMLQIDTAHDVSLDSVVTDGKPPCVRTAPIR
jgi:hypothetical protein